ncbi:MAG TPA: bifunctional 4-hydroxy-2-oxoglutarate aldolase/2-dehydro-3-deoxy-phosphogluconate aldolase [Terriglobales bacterium]|nr:bifunctional 4-hydroxy-2-oxoglutarate aldolase/2-dehydro-3-deoxy-phosphogluconate aldolase [Terriglobales bacterium]
MTTDEVIRKIGDIAIIPVVRAATVDEASRAVDAICDGGIRIVEITMTVPDAPKLIEGIVRRYGNELLTGAGTVLTAEQAKSCLDAGAEFLVSPGLSLPALCTAKACDKLMIPGALTPTEVMEAALKGAKLIKIFPCGNVGGPKYIRSLKAPFPELALIPTGGVNAANAGDYIAAGAFALGAGADLVDPQALRNGDARKITAAARKLVEAVQAARAGTKASS